MSSFERATIKWARLAVIMAAVAAIFVCAQWYEMHTGGQDTHDLAIAAKAQADKMRAMSEAADQIRQAAQNMSTQEQRTADSSQKAIEANARQSRTALDVSIAASQLDERAWVGVGGAQLTQFEPDKEIIMEAVLINTGKTPARSAKECSGYLLSKFYLKEPTRESIEEIEKKLRTSTPLAPQGKFTVRLGHKELADRPEDLGASELLRQSYLPVKEHMVILYMFGEYRYLDITGKSRVTKYCVYVSNPDTKELHFCDGFNEID